MMKNRVSYRGYHSRNILEHELHQETGALYTSSRVIICLFPIFQMSIEYGLSEMMNTQAMGGIVGKVAPGVSKWFPDLPELEAIFPAGTIDHSAEPIYPGVTDFVVGSIQHIAQWQHPSKAIFGPVGTKMGRVHLGGKKQICKRHQGSG